MQQVNVISPIHIGTGEKYPNYTIINSQRYLFDDLIGVTFSRNKAKLLSPNFLTKIMTINQSKSGDAKREIAELISPNEIERKNLKPVYNVKLGTPKTNQLDINEHTKNLNQLMIPGSSMKGYIMNVIYYDIVKNDPEIQRYYQQNLANRREIENVERNVNMIAGSKIICRDILFDSSPTIKLVTRITKKGGIPNVFECIDTNASTQGEFFIKNQSIMSDERLKPHEKKLLQAIEQRLNNLKVIFPKINAQFMRNVLIYEKEFIDKINVRDDIDKHAIYQQISRIEQELSKGKIIVQIGRNTNYIAKSIGTAFDVDFYKNNFETLFYPGMGKGNNKQIAKPYTIGSMNLVSQDQYENYVEIPGFMEIVW
ncbi:MAG TPA: hypothetical protein PLR26_06995 [Bacilli bacterium]|nr:hypothetical protein [Bacilli bacterium]